MRRILPAVLLSLSTAGSLAAQAAVGPPQSRNAIYLELLGSAGGGAFNYERLVSERLRLRLGAGSWGSESTFESSEYTAAPVTLSALWGSGNHHLELGGGVLGGRKTHKLHLDDSPVRTTFVSLSGIVGYRFQPPRRGFLFRAGFTPFLGLGSGERAYPDGGLVPSLGLSFGYGF